MASFLTLNDRIVNLATVDMIDCSRMEQEGIVSVQLKNGVVLELGGAHAIDIVMRTAPGLVEGRRFRWVRHGWALHNLLGHPVLQVLAWVGLLKWGLAVHDATIPRPRAFR